MAPPPTDVSAALQGIPEKKQFLRKVFGDLEEHRAVIAQCSGGWKAIDLHLTAIYEALESRYAEVVEKEKKFDAKMAEMQASLDKRESVIESREQASLARVQEQKEIAVATICEQRRKWNEERQLLESQSQAKPDPDLRKEGSKVSSKEESGAQEKANQKKDKGTSAKGKDDAATHKKTKDNATSRSNVKAGSTPKAQKTKGNTGPTPKPNEEGSKNDAGEKSKEDTKLEEADCKQEADQQEEAKNKQGLGVDNVENLDNESQAMEVDDDEDGAKTVNDDGRDEEDKKNEDEASGRQEDSSMKVRPELKLLCENMDGPGLLTFVMSQKKAINLLRKELPVALKCASDPPQLILKALEGYPSAGSSSEGNQGKKNTNQRSCITLLESLAVVQADEGKDASVASHIKEEAKKVAEMWKSNLKSKSTELSALLDIHSFIQLLATFGLASDYNVDELCDLLVPICNRKNVVALSRKLGLTDKVPDLVKRLMKEGKQLDAVMYVQEYQLTEQFSLVGLLKTYLKDIRNSHTSKMSPEDKNELHMKELIATKEVLKCIEKYKLEAEYPVDGLQRRIAQLEKVSSDRKRNSDAGGVGSKKARTGGSGVPHSATFNRSSDRQHFGGRGIGMGGHGYGSPYGRFESRGGYPYLAGGYGASSYSHGDYPYGGGPSPYQGPFMH